MRCQLPVRQLLVERPACACSFRLARPVSPQLIVPSLADVLGRGCEAHRQTLLLWREPLARALSLLAQGEGDGEVRARAETLAAALTQRKLPDAFRWPDARLIARALPLVELRPLSIETYVPAALPATQSEPIMQDEPATQTEQWLDNLPGNPPALLDFHGESGRNAD
jgi:hypothetical protein